MTKYVTLGNYLDAKLLWLIALPHRLWMLLERELVMLQIFQD
jgi:hypothetical protein